MGVVGLAENKANSAQLELEAGAELGNIVGFDILINCETFFFSWVDTYHDSA